MAGVCVKKTMKSQTELPEEVLHDEILTRLPLKSVVRFKSVCKSWLSLFTQPKFVKQHLTRSASQNPHDYDRLVANNGRAIVIISRYEETYLLPRDFNCSYKLLGSVNGLICLYSAKKFLLWNPAILQFKVITLPSSFMSSFIYRIGLGFDHVSNNYKVVVIKHIGEPACVYSSNSDSWIDLPKYEFREWDSGSSIVATTAIVKNCPYWTYVSLSRKHDGTWLRRCGGIKFDVGSDQFKLLPQFDAVMVFRPSSDKFSIKFVNVRDRLTLVLSERSHSRMVELYSLDEEGCGVWSKMYSVLLYGADLSQGFKNSDEIVFKKNGMMYCYDQKSNTSKRILSAGCGDISSCFTYTPSLAFLQGMQSVHLQTETQTRELGYNYTTPWRLISSLIKEPFTEGHIAD